jgi:hypothetical protein
MKALTQHRIVSGLAVNHPFTKSTAKHFWGFDRAYLILEFRPADFGGPPRRFGGGAVLARAIKLNGTFTPD